MKMKNLMQFEAKTYKGLNKNKLAKDVVAFLNTYYHSTSQDKEYTNIHMVKYADMDLTHFIRAIVKQLEMQNLIKDLSEAS